MKNRNYYAALLTGAEPKIIWKVFAFKYPSQRDQWLTEKHFPEGERVKIVSKVAKKHKHIEVQFRSAVRGGATAWSWFFNGEPDWLTEMFEGE
jgi:hypothetical protein